jgi:hypothetical protein
MKWLDCEPEKPNNPQPLYYTDKVGGLWMRIPEDFELDILCLPAEGSWGKYPLMSLPFTRPTRIGTRILTFHSLLFGEEDDKNAPRWDCINGWTTPLPEAPEEDLHNDPL